MIRYLTAGESHGVGYTLIIDGFPAGFKIDFNHLQSFLNKRQNFFGRSTRSCWEENLFRILSGVSEGVTTGAPLSFFIENNSKSQKKPFKDHLKTPRPGHADLAGMLKFDHKNVELVWERASGRETVVRTLCGALSLQFLKEFEIDSLSHVTNIGGVKTPPSKNTFSSLKNALSSSNLLCSDSEIEELMKEKIKSAEKEKTSLGGIFELRMTHLPIGLGSYTQWDQKLDALIAHDLMSIQGIKGVQFGIGFLYGETPGHQAHDEIISTTQRKTNNAGGIEGGMTNGEEIIVSCTVKPPATLLKPLSSIDVDTQEKTKAFVSRSDVCFVPSAAVVGEAVLGIQILNAFLKKFGGDSLSQTKKHYETYCKQIK
ncbi:MAG: chorismate synthase [Deltaproteobacteria bacterium]|nr:chorismate synthase [Deltaproteobacteria bacterium]